MTTTRYGIVTTIEGVAVIEKETFMLPNDAEDWARMWRPLKDWKVVRVQIEVLGEGREGE